MSEPTTVALSLPRHAVSPRQVARAGDIWRMMQEAAVQASSAAGWPPERYVTEGIGFIVYEMAVRHHRELTYGEWLQASTWVRDFRRGVLSKREVRLEGRGGPVASATQHWAHVGADLKPRRASPELLSSFEPLDRDDPEIVLPELAESIEDGPVTTLSFGVWHTWMDPLGHVNHPHYVDFCDEATARLVAERGIDPQQMVSVFDHVSWKGGAVATDQLVVHSRVTGQCEGAWMLEHQITKSDGSRVAEAHTLRRLPPDAELL